MKEPREKIQSIDRAVSILDYLANKNSGERLSTIAKDLHLNKSTAFGIISTLKALGLLGQDPETEKYSLGYCLIRYGMAARANSNYLKIANKYLQELQNDYGETIQISILTGTEAILVDKLEGLRTVRVATKIGDRFPVNCSAAGKVLVAFSEEPVKKNILEKCSFGAKTENTITDRRKFEKVLQKVMVQGYALDEEENGMGYCCISAPILSADGYAIAAFSLTFPTERSLHTDEKVIETVKSVSQKISAELGYIVDDE